MISDLKLLCIVEDIFDISMRGIIIVPGIPSNEHWNVKVGDKLIVRVTGRQDCETHVAGIELSGRPTSLEVAEKRSNLGIPILIGSEITAADVPKGAEIWIKVRRSA